MKRYSITGAEQVESHRDFKTMNMEAVAMGSDSMNVSDGYHTMDELYDHRITLFIALCRVSLMVESDDQDPHAHVWRSKEHHPEDQKMYAGYFILGFNKRDEHQITYHLPLSRWEETEFAVTLNHAPKWDGHTPADVLERLKAL